MSQPALFAVPSVGGWVWAHEGRTCARCRKGPMRMVHPSNPEHDVAEGYAKCSTCGALEQCWRKDMRRADR